MSTYHEKEFYIINGIHGSRITARRKSDGRTINRDASKFRFFYDAKNENWRERLLSSGCSDQPSTQNRNEEEMTRQEHNEQRGEDSESEINNHQPRRQTRQQEETQRRELPKRTATIARKIQRLYC